ncbi:DUF3015 domain-containing protein [Lujinxingia vulgaris]|uniref:DUF3015 domain-containing protein n=1 Tax=Lujinxingia vulgaris TaxID=2600176 RepID=A0A5C6X1S4_9DELT|nr:DUF3015 family protein [Lujinxingia vulgaris]TXD32755.1 DUF3015 domain-containing protein [Lujinxingia vulgaris]
MATTRTRVGLLSVALLLAYAAPALAHSTSSGVGNGAHPVSASSVNGAASDSENSSAGSEGSSAGSGESSAASGNSSAASEGTSGGSTDSSEASEGSSNSESSASSEQQDPPPEDPDDDANNVAGAIVGTAILGTATASTVGSVLLTIFAVNELSAELYLRSNGHALRHHITRGAGDALEDLAHLCGVPTTQYANFAEATRQARHALVPHLEEPRSIDAEETRAFLRALAEALSHDRELATALITNAYAG